MIFLHAVLPSRDHDVLYILSAFRRGSGALEWIAAGFCPLFCRISAPTRISGNSFYSVPRPEADCANVPCPGSPVLLPAPQRNRIVKPGKAGIVMVSRENFHSGLPWWNHRLPAATHPPASRCLPGGRVKEGDTGEVASRRPSLPGV